MRLDYVGLAKQAAMGTPQTVMEYFPPVESGEPDHQRENIEQEETTGTRHPSGVDHGVEFWKPSFNGAARYSSLPRILSMFFGAPVTTATADVTAKKHSFASGAPLAHSVKMARKDPNPNIIDLFTDVLGDELEISIQSNGFMKYAAKCVAREIDEDEVYGVPVTDASGRMAFDTVTAFISVNGGAEAPLTLRTFSQKYSNKVDTEDEQLGSRRLASIAEGNSACEVEFGVIGAGNLSAHYRRAIKADPDSVKIRVLATGPIIGTGVAFAYEQIVYACEYVEAPANIDAASRLNIVTVKARAKYDTAASKFVDHAVTNAVATY